MTGEQLAGAQFARKAARVDGRTKRARQLKEHDAHMERLRASLTRLQDPEYVMQVIKRCQEHGLIPKDAA